MQHSFRTLASHVSVLSKVISPVFISRHGVKSNLTKLNIRSFTASIDSYVKSAELKSPEKHTFKAETKRLLQIVADSLYSEKEVFIRELLSNSSDACEKLKFYQLTDSSSVQLANDSKMSISIKLDSEKNLFILEDHGIGMSLDELDSHLGTIALSGATSFLSSKSPNSPDIKNSIIGQFGVGFYSAFTVGKKIEVYSKSARALPSDPINAWSCDNGDSDYSLYQVPFDDPSLQDFKFGTRIVVHLKEEESKYATEKVVLDLIKKYSNFLSFPISVNGNIVNTLPPLWMMPKSDITSEQYQEFFKHISGSDSVSESYKYVLHYSIDAPVQMRCLLFIPKDISSIPYSQSSDQDTPKMNLYCKKVLIKGKTADLLPSWLSFVRGVVDSEDIPLNLSRELLQNSVLLSKIRKTLTNRIIRWLLDEQRSNPIDFAVFYKKLAPYIKGGIMSDDKKEVSQLLMFESSFTEIPSNENEESDHSTTCSIPTLTTLKSYIERMPEDQKDIYICLSKNRQTALSSPYYEPFKLRGLEVLFSYDPLDEFLIPSLDGLIEGKSVKRIEDVNLTVDSKEELSSSTCSLNEPQIMELVSYLKKIYPSTLVQNVKASIRFPNHPALIVDHALQSTTFKYFKQMMAMQASENSSDNLFSSIPPLDLEINPQHPLIINLYHLHTQNESLAKTVSLQILDNARMEAGLLEDTHEMVTRISSLLEKLTKTHSCSLTGKEPLVEVVEGETIKQDTI